MSVIERVQVSSELDAWLRETRRYLHMNPELSLEESNTVAAGVGSPQGAWRSASHPRRGRRPPADGGSRGFWKRGNDAQAVDRRNRYSRHDRGHGTRARRLLIRADMDALPIDEKNDTPYRSTKRRGHARLRSRRPHDDPDGCGRGAQRPAGSVRRHGQADVPAGRRGLRRGACHGRTTASWTTRRWTPQSRCTSTMSTAPVKWACAAVRSPRRRHRQHHGPGCRRARRLPAHGGRFDARRRAHVGCDAGHHQPRARPI